MVAPTGAIQHIAASDQLFRTRHINDGARVHLRLDRKGDTRRDIRLDKTGDDVHRGTLGAQNQVDTGGASLLRQPADGGFHIGGRRHHQVSQLVDDDIICGRGGCSLSPAVTSL